MHPHTKPTKHSASLPSANNLHHIKPEMLSEAARNARIAANEFAENAGAKES